MPTQDEMLRSLIGLDANPNNYTLADAVGNTDTTTARARALIGLDDNPNNYTLADVLGYAVPSVPKPQPAGPTQTQQARVEAPVETRTYAPAETAQDQGPTYTAVNDTGRVAPEVIDNSPNPFLSNDPNAGWIGTPAATTQPTITAVDINGNPVTTEDLAALTSGAAPVYTNSTFNAADSGNFGPTLDTTASNLAALTSARALTSDTAAATPAALPTAYYAGETLQDYLAAQRAAFIPQHVEATPDVSLGGDNGFIPGVAAYDTAFGDTSGDIEEATNDYYKALRANETPVVPIGKGWGLQDWVPSAAENNVDPNYAGWARLIGFQGPTTRDAGYTYHPPEAYGAGESTSAGETPGYWAPKTEATPEFKQALAGYGFKQTEDKHGNGIVQMVDPTGKVLGQQRVYSGEGSFSQFMKTGLMAFAAYALGPLAGEALGAAGAGTLGSAAAGADLGLLGINTGLAAGTTGGAALGTVAGIGGNVAVNTLLNTVVNDQDLGDALTNATKSAGTSFLGGQVAGFVPTDLTGTGNTLLNEAATGAVKGAASGVIGAAASGNSLWDAALAGATSGGLNGTVGGSLQTMGFNPADATAAIKIFNGIKNENFADILNGANQFINSPDVGLAGKAATLVRAIESKNPTAVFNAGKDFSSGLTGDAAAKIAAAYADPSRKLDVLQNTGDTAGGTALNTTSLEGAGPATTTTGTATGATTTSGTPAVTGTVASTEGDSNAGLASVATGAARVPDTTSAAAKAALSQITGYTPTTFGQIEAAKIFAERYPGQDLSWVDKGMLNAAASHIMAGDEAGLRARLANGQALGVVPDDSWTDPDLQKYTPPEGYRVAKDSESATEIGYTDAGKAVYIVPQVEVSGGTAWSKKTDEEKAAYNAAHPIERPESDYKIDEKGDKVLKSPMELAQDFTDSISKGLTAPLVKAVGEQISLMGVVGRWFGANPDNPVSEFGKMVEKYGNQITPEKVIDQQKNIETAIKNEDTLLGKGIAAVVAGVTNPLGLADWAVKELGQDVAPLMAGVKIGQMTKAAASAFGETIASRLGLSAAVGTEALADAGESAASAYGGTYDARIKAGDTKEQADDAATKAAITNGLVTLVTSGIGSSATINKLINNTKSNVFKNMGMEAGTEFFDSGLGQGFQNLLEKQGSSLDYKDLASNVKLDINQAVQGALIGAGASGLHGAGRTGESDTTTTGATTTGATTTGATTTGATTTGATTTGATTAPATELVGPRLAKDQTVLTGQNGETLSAIDLGLAAPATTGATTSKLDADQIIQQYVDLGLAGNQTGNTAAELAALTGTEGAKATVTDNSAVVAHDSDGNPVTVKDLTTLTTPTYPNINPTYPNIYTIHINYKPYIPNINPTFQI